MNSLADRVEAFRRIARRVPPWGVETTPDGETVLVDAREDAVLATLKGQWAPDVAAYLSVLNPYAALRLAELLWHLGKGHHGAAERLAVEMLDKMRLDER